MIKTSEPDITEVQRLLKRVDEDAKGTRCLTMHEVTLCLGELKKFYTLATARRYVRLGVIEFHSKSFNPGLIERFFSVVKDLRDSASIVDLWLMDIRSVLKEFGYEMEVTTTRPGPLSSVDITKAK